MKRLYFFSIILLFFILSVSPVMAQDLPNFSGRAHLENIGWVDVNSDENHHMLLGTVGENRRIEAYTLQSDYPNLGIRYQSHVQDIGWQGAVENGQISGTEGQSKKIEALNIQLIGDNAPNFNLFYRTYVQNYGWLDWTTNFGTSGTTNHNYRCEAIEIVIYPKDAPAPGSMTTPAVQATSRDESRHMYLVNRLRKQYGLNYLTGDYNLKAVANLRAQEIAQKFSHIRPNGQLYETAVKSVFPNYNQVGGEIIENINLARTTRMTDPAYAFAYLSTYTQQVERCLDPAARYLSWSCATNGRLGFSVELFSGLDRIDFAD